MTLPFSREQFFEVFATYHAALWPAPVILALLALGLLLTAWRAPAGAGRVVAAGLALLWTWMALAYHLAFFRAVNPAAPLFAALSLGAAAAFLWFGVYRAQLQFGHVARPRRLLAGPLLWAGIGATAAVALDVPQDTALFVMVGLGVYLCIQRLPPVTPPARHS